MGMLAFFIIIVLAVAVGVALAPYILPGLGWLVGGAIALGGGYLAIMLAYGLVVAFGSLVGEGSGAIFRRLAPGLYRSWREAVEAGALQRAGRAVSIAVFGTMGILLLVALVAYQINH